MIEKVMCRRSNSGVPHFLVVYEGIEFSVCYFGKTNLYRIFLYGTENKKLGDFPLDCGGSFSLEFVLIGLIEKYNLKLQQDPCGKCTQEELLDNGMCLNIPR